jgi:hypothetical protein
MSDKIFLEQDSQCILNIVEALQFYRDNAVKPKFRKIIDEQLKDLGEQLKLQDINIFIKDMEPLFKYGDSVTYEGKTGVIVGLSNEDEFIEIAISNNGNIEKIEVPLVLINKVEDK